MLNDLIRTSTRLERLTDGLSPDFRRLKTAALGTTMSPFQNKEALKYAMSLQNQLDVIISILNERIEDQ